MSRVYRAVHIEDHRVAACKVVQLTPKTTAIERKTLDKEMRVHAALKHSNVLEFINAVIVEPDDKTPWHPGVYMLLEFAAGGDLFDKIGYYFFPTFHRFFLCLEAQLTLVILLLSTRSRCERRSRTSVLLPTHRRTRKHALLFVLIFCSPC